MEGPLRARLAGLLRLVSVSEKKSGRIRTMKLGVRATAAASCVLALSFAAAPAFAQKQGGILKMYHRDSPASASIHEEATYSNNVPFMPVFNNLVFYKQDVAQNSLQSIVPELATDWAWSPDNTKLTFNLRGGVKWH